MGNNAKKNAQEEYLKKMFIEGNEENIDDLQVKSEVYTKTISNAPSFTNSLEYLSVDLEMLPLGIFYQNGIKIKIRAAKVHEIQAYSIISNENILDVTEKMNQMLSSCVKVTLPNGQNGSYKDIKDGDRLFIIFMIRELTFQKGNSLAKEVVCEHCTNEFSIPFRSTANSEYPKTFVNHDMPTELKRFYNSELRCFEFKINETKYRMAPPTIGIQEIFYGDIKTKMQNKKTPNVAFLKIIPFLLWDKTSITDEGIKAKEDEFKRMDMETFQIINQAVNKIVFGLKGLEMKCPSCGLEVHTDMSFPRGASDIFVVSDFFDNFAKE